MEARLSAVVAICAAFLSLGASYRTQNFVVTAGSPQFAKQVGDHAELFRRKLAIEWLGRELPPWPQPCPIRVRAHPGLGAGGATSFYFRNRQPFGWRMSIQGSQQRILDSVLPHEVTHTIFATHFGRPLPRWADEGACTTVEHEAEKAKQKRMLIQFLTTHRGIAFNRMFAMKEYPRDVLPLYSQGYSLARYLIQQGGKQKFVRYVGEGMDTKNWPATTRKHYGFRDLSDLQVTWLAWIRRGSPQLAGPERPTGATQLASLESGRRQASSPHPVVRAQSPDARLSPHKNGAGAKLVPVPSNQMTSAGKTGKGWYARQRDLARNKQVALPTQANARQSPAGASTAGVSTAGATTATASTANASARAKETYAPGSIARASHEVLDKLTEQTPMPPDREVMDRTMTRPQSPQGPRQRILEWSRNTKMGPGEKWR